MSRIDVKTILKQVEQLLAMAGTLPAEAEEAVEKLLNVVETLYADRQSLVDEVERLRQELEKKKRAKTTSQQNQDDNSEQDDSNHSSEHRRKQDRKKPQTPDRRSFKDLKIHEEIECPVDPKTLPPDAVRVADEVCRIF
jgi:cobalamin-dependent methionine synthase I